MSSRISTPAAEGEGGERRGERRGIGGLLPYVKQDQHTSCRGGSGERGGGKRRGIGGLLPDVEQDQHISC